MSDVVDALRALTKSRGGTKMRVDELFGDEPATLAAIGEAWKAGMSTRSIAATLTAYTDADESISPNAISSWCEKNYGTR